MHQVRMRQSESESFPADVARKLKTYVYRLIDPRNGETFYVGKGHGNRGGQEECQEEWGQACIST